jgi:hypothetical protein
VVLCCVGGVLGSGFHSSSVSGFGCLLSMFVVVVCLSSLSATLSPGWALVGSVGAAGVVVHCG